MATVNYTSTASTSLGGTVSSAGLVQKAYDRLVEFALRSQPMVRSVADKRPSAGTLPGSSIALQLYNDLSPAVSALTETDDVDAVALATPNIVTVTLNEYGNSVVTTRKLQLFSLADVDPAVANIVAYNMADSIDKLAMAQLIGGTNVQYSGDATSTATVAAAAGAGVADTLKAADIRKVVAKLRAKNAVPRRGAMYWVGVHPEASHDLRAETGAASWRDPHVYSQPSEIWAGEIGAFEGAYFIETPRMYVAGDGATVGSQVSVSGIVIASGVATVTAASHGYKTGDFVAISGSTGVDGLNATWQITVTGTGTFTFVTSLSGTVAGTIKADKKDKVYRTIVAGQQALAEAVAEEPHVVIGNVTDRLNRLRPIGWYGVLGFARYREDALYRIESASSIA